MSFRINCLFCEWFVFLWICGIFCLLVQVLRWVHVPQHIVMLSGTDVWFIFVMSNFVLTLIKNLFLSACKCSWIILVFSFSVKVFFFTFCEIVGCVLLFRLFYSFVLCSLWVVIHCRWINFRRFNVIHKYGYWHSFIWFCNQWTTQS